MDEFERLATYEELDRQPNSTMGDYWADVAEWGHYTDTGGELSEHDWAEAVSRPRVSEKGGRP